MEMDLWTNLQTVVVVGMESSTEKDQKNNLDHVQLAIERLMEQSRDKRASGELSLNDEDDDHLLSKLLSQLESLKGDASLEQEQPPAATEPNEASTSDNELGKSRSNTESESDEIIKELKKVRKQKKITHWLLAIMIVLTVTWQLSEVSLLLMVKNRIKNPFRSLGNMFSGMLQIKGPKIPDEEKLFKQLQIETTSLPHLTLPELPMEMLDLSGNGGEDG